MARREKVVSSIEEINEILDVCKRYSIIKYDKWDKAKAYFGSESLSNYTFIKEGMATIEVTTKYYEFTKSKKFVPCTYMFRKDGKESYVLSGGVAFETMQKYWKAPDVDEDFHLEKTEKGSYALSAKPLVGSNKKYRAGEYNIWEYDINSAYAAAMMEPIPDTTAWLKNRVVGKNQIGFMLIDGLPTRHEGEYADVVFYLMDSPYKKFATKYFDMKKNAKNNLDKTKAKAVLVEGVGMLQRHNPFIRACIVNRCNEKIKSLIRSDTLMWNTDAIYSLVPRDDLDIGDGLGQFKVEHAGECMEFVSVGAYHFKGEDVKYRGVPTKWFDKSHNILTDGIPDSRNIYKLNRETITVEEINYEV